MPKSLLSLGAAPLRIHIPAELTSDTALLAYLGCINAEVQVISRYRARMYHRFNIARASGKLRVISAPDKRLKFLQRKIVGLLDKIYSVRNPVHGFVKGRSVRTNALAHMPRKFVLNLDLKEFFPSIREGRVHGMLTSLGIDDSVAP